MSGHASVLSGEAAGHENSHSEVDHGFGLVWVGFVVADQAAGPRSASPALRGAVHRATKVPAASRVSPIAAAESSPQAKGRQRLPHHNPCGQRTHHNHPAVLAPATQASVHYHPHHRPGKVVLALH